MPRIKSAKKRVDVAERNRQRNTAFKSAIRTAIKKTKAPGADTQAREAGLREAFSLIDSAILKGIMHKNTGSRYKSRLAKSVQKVAS